MEDSVVLSEIEAGEHPTVVTEDSDVCDSDNEVSGDSFAELNRENENESLKDEKKEPRYERILGSLRRKRSWIGELFCS